METILPEMCSSWNCGLNVSSTWQNSKIAVETDILIILNQIYFKIHTIEFNWMDKWNEHLKNYEYYKGY